MTRSEEDTLEIARYALKTGDESVTEQYEEVQSVRLRASFLITVNALSSTLFSQFLPANSGISLGLGLALLFFVVCNIFSLLLMMPTGNWRITKSGGKIVRDFLDENQDVDASQAFGVLAIKTDEDQIENEQLVSKSHSRFFFAVAAFAASTVFWMMEIGVSRVLAIEISL